jgi:hypothetical protein
MGSLKIDQAIAQQLLEAIDPGGIQAAIQASESGALADEEKRRALELALERARYEVQRTRRQYDAVDPENRLVAGELEARWNTALKNVAELESRRQELGQQPAGLSSEQRQRLLDLGSDLPRLWNDPQASVELKKQILRTVIEEIVVKSMPESVQYELQIHWAGGVHTELRVARNKPGMHGKMADGKVVELVAELVKVCDDKTMAGVLNRLGHRTGQGNSWSASRVSAFRHTHGLSTFEKQEDWMTLEQAAHELKVSHTAVKTLIRKGILPAKQVVRFAPWVIEKKNLQAAEVQAAARASQRGRRVPPTDSKQQQLTI